MHRTKRAKIVGAVLDGPAGGLRHKLEVVASAPYRVTQCPEEPEDQADHERDYSDRPHNGDPRDEPDDQKDYAENDHGRASTAAG